MSGITRSIEVRYWLQVHFTEHLFAPTNRLLRDVLVDDHPGEARKAIVVADEALVFACPALPEAIGDYFAAFPEDLKLAGLPIVLEGGERTKNSYFHVSEVQSQIDRYHIDRHSYVVAVGGGALLDMVGLAAATAHRGVRHVRVPSTTLAQADSGVGVKNAINAFGKKNFIGTFAPPFAVLNDFALLDSLPARDKRCGYAEAVKVALIRDAAFFEAMEADAEALARFDAAPMRRVIMRSAELHVNHIATSGDPFEFGSARPLDFGHWSAHKLEQISGFRMRHGEAVATGIALDTLYAQDMGWLKPVEAERILALLERLGFELFANELLHAGREGGLVLLHGLEEFREHLGGQLTLTMPRGIGEAFEVHEVDLPRMTRVIQALQARALGVAAASDGEIPR